MAIRDFYSDVDLKANQLFNSRLHNITTAARIALGLGLTIADKGYQVFDTDTESAYYWNGITWVAAFTLPILTAGSVVFSNGLTLAEDNANFFWNDVNNRLGIGNASPSYPLDVTGVIRGTSDAIINGLTVGKGFTNNASATAFGVDANSVNTSLFATAFGYQALKNNTSGGFTAIGYQAGLANTSGQSNAALGYQALSTNITGSFNTAVGSNCMTFATGSQNSGFGFQALDSVSGTFNVGMGYRALRFLTSGTFNTAVGGASSNNIGTGSFNTTAGYGALGFGTPGNANSNNVSIGFTSLWQALGNNNTALGFQAGRFIANGSTAATAIDNSILIGYNTKVLANSQTNQIVIGYDETGLGSNTTIIGNSSTVTTALRGNLLLGSTTDSGQKLQVTGTAIISGTTTLSSLSGVGSRMVVTDALGELSTAAIPVGTVTSVGLSMPTAFTVTNSPVTGAGTLTVTGAGTSDQYVRGDLSLGVFPSSPSGGGSSIGYYLNGSVAASVAGYEQLSRDPIFGLGTNYTTSTDGLIAQFLTDVGDPAFLSIPAGAWLIDLYFSADSVGGDPDFYVELYKYDGATFTLLSTNVTTPEVITNGTAVDLYITSLSVPTTTLTLTDRLAIRVYVDCNGKTLTLHTENDNLSQVVTTFSTGIATLNGLVAQVQYFGVGTTGTDFNISSATNTHTFHLPTASATNRGALSSADWSTFDGKQAALNGTGFVKISGTTISYDNSSYYLSSNPSNFIPLTALSSTATGLTYTNTTGVFSLTAGYLIPTTAGYNNTNWDTAYTNRITSLTTTGSGAATLIANVLNIPTPAAPTFTSLTVTGDSGASTLLAGVLNVPTYTLSGLGGQPLATNLTSLSGLTYASTSFVKMTAAGTFALDTNTYYLASNPSGFTSNTGTVTTASVVSANGFAGTVANASTTPAITLSTSVTGLLKGNGTAISAASAGTDYQAPITLSTIGGTPNAEGMTISGASLTLQPADENFGGIVTTGNQNFSGKKYFWNAIYVVDTGGIPTVSIANTGITFENSALGTGTIFASNIGGTVSYELPSNSGTFALSVNSIVTDNAGDIYLTAASVGAEPALGNPSTSGYVLSSTTAGVRSWIAAGGGGSSTTFTTQSFTATAAQTTFTISGGYTPGLIQVNYNGSTLTVSEYTASNGTTVVLGFAAELNDILDFIIFTTTDVLTAKAFTTITYSGTPNWDYGTGYNKEITLTGAATLSITNDSDGDYGVLFVTQDGVGGRVLTLPVGDNITGLTAQTTASSIVIYSYAKRGSVRYWNASNR